MKKEESDDRPLEGNEEEDDPTKCELFGWSPKWIQRFADIKYYVIVYGFLGLGDFAVGSYMVATISTIEKRFSIPSRISGIIMSIWDVGGIACMILLTYLGSRGRRTRWVAGGALMVTTSCAVRLIPHFLYGPGENSKFYTGNITAFDSQSNSTCELGPREVCLEGNQEELMPTVLFGVANFILGVGTCVYYTLGIAYLDDNANKNKVPWLLAVVFCIRMFGPTLGFMLASYCLDLFVDPFATPSIGSDDPRWIGAWWLGWIPLALINFTLALIMLPFPREIRGLPKEEKINVKKGKASFQDFKETFGRLIKNKVLVFNSVSSTLYMFGLSGYWTFMPKYMETQFNQSASKASFITGSVGLVCTALGVIISGASITRFKPRPQYLAAWNVFVECIDIAGQISFAFLGCPTENYQGFWSDGGDWNMTETCNMNCSCGSDVKYTPLCSNDGLVSFYSPCHAGCTSNYVVNNTKVYENCSCSSDGIVTGGVCPVDCTKNFTMFLVILCLLRFFGASGRAGNAIIQFRSVSPEDKSLSIAFTEFMVSLFAFIPAPIFYGILLDSTCLVWGETCGESGNCWLYNGQTLRYALNFVSSGFVFMSMLADVGVWYYCGHLKIYDEDDKKETKLTEPTPEPSLVPLLEANDATNANNFIKGSLKVD